MIQQPHMARSQGCTENWLGSTGLALELVLPDRWIASMKTTTETPPPVPQDIMERLRI